MQLRTALGRRLRGLPLHATAIAFAFVLLFWGGTARADLKLSGQVTRTHSHDGHPFWISKSDCESSDDNYTFTFSVSPSDGSYKLQIWTSETVNCLTGVDRTSPTTPKCKQLHVPNEGSIAKQTVTVTLKSKDIAQSLLKDGSAECDDTSGSTTPRKVNLAFILVKADEEDVAATNAVSFPQGTYDISVDLVGPGAPNTVTASPEEGAIQVDFKDTPPSDLQGYYIYCDPPPATQGSSNGSCNCVGAGLGTTDGGTTTAVTTTTTTTTTTAMAAYKGPPPTLVQGTTGTDGAAGANGVAGGGGAGGTGGSSTGGAENGGADDEYPQPPPPDPPPGSSGSSGGSTDMSSAASGSTDTLSGSGGTGAAGGTGGTGGTASGGSGGTGGASGTCDDPTCVSNITDTACVSCVLGSNMACPSRPAPNTGVYQCGKISGNGLSGRAQGLVNGSTYSVAVAGYDILGNVGPLSPVACAQPREVSDFFETYRKDGGKGGGGCAIDPRFLTAGNTAPLLGIAAAIALLARRRKRSGRSGDAQ